MEQEILNYVVSLGPAVTSIIAAIASIIVAVRKVKAVVSQNEVSNIEQKKMMKEMQNQINAVFKENQELKKELVKEFKRRKKIHDDGEE